MSPVSRGLVIGSVEAAGTPILLVHGLVDNRSIFALLRRGLRRRGFGLVRTVNYPLLTSDIRGAAVRLAGQVEQTCRETGYERIHVVGHSLGGLIARYYVQRLAGDERVHTLVTLGTPHSGTRAAHLLPRSLCGQLRPGSDVLTELAGPAAGCATRFLCFWTDLDQLVLPRDSARLDHPDLLSRNVLVSGVGHLSLPINGRVVREICHALAHLDADGTTRTPGVTPLARRPNPPALRTAPRRRAARRSAGEAG
jgi:pimeloyl-ACP methyl ester carboxylesterase